MALPWIDLASDQQLDDVIASSQLKPILIFKHSTRCSISSVALDRLNRSTVNTNIDYYLLDLIAYRQLSNTIAEKFKVYHESPQVLLISKGECVYDESHMSIRMQDIDDEVAQLFA
ncbi:MAG: bacillithiol system redox-active protein YtxJ [Bacteroidota bacterium]|jgi:bacillithiol system protein YtxJ